MRSPTKKKLQKKGSSRRLLKREDKIGKRQTKILVVDDEEDLREELSEILQDEGYNVVSAQNAHEAIACVEDNGFTIIFMDIVLPDINGVEAYKAIKKISPGITTVMMTGYSVEDLVKEAMDECAYACLYKPFEIDKVLNTVNEIMGRVERRK